MKKTNSIIFSMLFALFAYFCFGFFLIPERVAVYWEGFVCKQESQAIEKEFEKAILDCEKYNTIESKLVFAEGLNEIDLFIAQSRMTIKMPSVGSFAETRIIMAKIGINQAKYTQLLLKEALGKMTLGCEEEEQFQF